VTAQDARCRLVQMKRIESNWKGPLQVDVFIRLLEKLMAMHTQNVLHGDIRQSNTLSSGHIIDLDFAHQRHYPEGLADHLNDGKRHPEVVKAIKEGCIGDLMIEKKHDIYSMGALLDRFDLIDASDQWKNAITFLDGNGDDESLPNAIEALQTIRKWVVQLKG
jgi:hypothetical protein